MLNITSSDSSEDQDSDAISRALKPLSIMPRFKIITNESSEDDSEDAAVMDQVLKPMSITSRRKIFPSSSEDNDSEEDDSEEDETSENEGSVTTNQVLRHSAVAVRRTQPKVIKDIDSDDPEGSAVREKALKPSTVRIRHTRPKLIQDNYTSEDDDLKSASAEIERFRLLIIGRSGCGKTTILSKVCGEEVADQPSTTRGIHNIEKEMEFKDNKLFIVHDSEGFEAGQEDEFQVVVNFIHARSLKKNINDRLHAIWYCLTTNSRPIQKSEEMFFAVKHGVPIVAIFTKFDLFVEDQLQELMENADDPENLDDEELEQQALKTTMEKFEKHYKDALLRKHCPPQAVVAVSNIHTSTPMDSRLAELINATSKALNVTTTKAGIRGKLDKARLRVLFASAQMADLQEKYSKSIKYGMPHFITTEYDRTIAASTRQRLFRFWGMIGVKHIKPILSSFNSHVENHPHTLGNKLSLKRPKMMRLTSLEQEAYRCVQLLSDMTVIMTEIFLLKAKEVAVVKDIVAKYPTTPAFPFIQDNLLELNWWSAHDKERLDLYKHSKNIQQIIDEAVRLNTASR